jgi:hypothetical protein
MEQSILKSTKKILGVSPDDDSFDLDIMTHINSAFSNLHDLGVGSPLGFVIEDDTANWDNLFEKPEEQKSMLAYIRSYIYLRVRLLFDPPGTSFLLDSINKQIEELEWRISVKREEEKWIETSELEVDEFEGTVQGVIDGGDAY